MTAYYNEIDPYAADWLRNLIAAGHIAPGVVDTRSIEDVHPADLQDFTQCHFFAGVGVWSLALRRAGWPDDRPVWTGSCPCQPFSAAGQGAGFADERHLWPAFHHLISERKPAAVLGEQVASKDADPWIDLVHTDLEALGYAFGAVPFPSAGVGAPHIRDRLYWAAVLGNRRHVVPNRDVQPDRVANANDGGRIEPQRLRDAGGLADAARPRSSVELGNGRQPPGRAENGSACNLGYSSGQGLAQRLSIARVPGWASGGNAGQAAVGAGVHAVAGPGPTNGYWRDADWLGCRDGKWRPVESGTFPLAHGATSRVGRLRAYGNAINAEAARVFVEAVMEAA